MKIKSYLFEQIPYSYSVVSKKWEFQCPGNHTFLSAAPGGAVTAHKIAKIINGCVKRVGCLDNLGRANIRNLINA